MLFVSVGAVPPNASLARHSLLAADHVAEAHAPRRSISVESHTSRPLVERAADRDRSRLGEARGFPLTTGERMKRMGNPEPLAVLGDEREALSTHLRPSRFISPSDEKDLHNRGASTPPH